jgi:capping protein beta
MDIVSSMLDLMRRLPPTRIEENVEALVQISPDYADDLSGNVDQPLKLRVDKATGKEYLACVYNQDGESYRCAAHALSLSLSLFPAPAFLITNGGRSPWSNEYDPPSEDGPIPAPKLRKLEIAANEAFDTYREM